ncbi:TonB-dependent receptor [Methylocella silvestris BL2]|uniref:TonB-dependent receptor n=1 Tax=Methylocella silvestris (strain DSM 15510 / CIP 108128 / LMG 27833 / NCIMB 13906 / BL2) TaxID=395965 RepID=B8EMC2_METSB|nr:TonB-dependent receptor [Methylocella silvestris]ACK52050.1 TonB-dependent receptor [Methylocella silvestris BL2]
MKTTTLPPPVSRVGIPLLLAIAASSGAFAQTAQPAAEAHVEDVVVTAPAEPESSDVAAFSEKQATKYQETPQAVTVITEQQLQNLQITNLQGAQKLAPSLNYKFSNVRNLTINIRGFGAASSDATDAIFGGVPIYIDGVYQPRPGQAVFDVPDLVGVEVLKGPQGTSGGQDSTGGAVKLTTALPSFVTQQLVEASYGSYNQVQFKGSATGAIAGSDKFAFRLAVFSNDHEGYVQNYGGYGGQNYNDWHSKGARGQILYQPDENLSVRLIFDYSHVNQVCCREVLAGVATQRANGAIVANNFFQRAGAVGFTLPIPFAGPQDYLLARNGYQQTAQETYGAAANINYTFNGFNLSSITSFRGWDFHPNNRSNVGTMDLITNTNGHITQRSVTQDLKLTLPKSDTFDGFFGVFYLYEQLYDWGLTTYGSNAGAFYGAPGNSRALNNAIYNLLGRQTYDNPQTNEVAPYVQGTWHATPELDITGGARYSYYDKTSLFRQYRFSSLNLSGFTAAQRATAISALNSFIGADNQFSADTNHSFFSALASASYKFTPDVYGYVTYARGGRDGGPNPSANLPTGTPTTVLPESVDSFETGVKAQFLDGRLLTNVAAFAMVNHNYITNFSRLSASGSTISYLANADSAISRGFEADIRYQPFEGLSTYASVTYDDAYYGSFDKAPCPYELALTSQTTCSLTGRRLSLTPRWAAAGGAEYSRNLGQVLEILPKPLVGYIGADVTFQTSTYSNTDDSIYSVVPSYALLNLHAGFKFDDGSWDLAAWVHNAANLHYWTNVSATVLPGGLIGGNVGDPLTAGVTLRAKL